MAKTLKDLMTRDPVTLAPQATAADAARLMRDHDIGDVIVCEGDQLCGIVTDRDLAVRCLAEKERPAERQLGEVCSLDVFTLAPDDSVELAVAAMKQRAIRRIPVVDGDRLVGVVSLGDLAQAQDAQSCLGQISAAPPNQ